MLLILVLYCGSTFLDICNDKKGHKTTITQFKSSLGYTVMLHYPADIPVFMTLLQSILFHVFTLHKQWMERTVPTMQCEKCI